MSIVRVPDRDTVNALRFPKRLLMLYQQPSNPSGVREPDHRSSVLRIWYARHRDSRIGGREIGKIGSHDLGQDWTGIVTDDVHS